LEENQNEFQQPLTEASSQNDEQTNTPEASHTVPSTEDAQNQEETVTDNTQIVDHPAEEQHAEHLPAEETHEGPVDQPADALEPAHEEPAITEAQEEAATVNETHAPAHEETPVSEPVVHEETPAQHEALPAHAESAHTAENEVPAHHAEPDHSATIEELTIQHQAPAQHTDTTHEATNVQDTEVAHEEAIGVESQNGHDHEFTISAPVAHDDFDWSVDKRNVSTYPNEKRQQLDRIYESTFKSIEESESLLGNVVGITKTDVIINIGFKSDGLVSLNEFRDFPDVKIGDDVEVMVVEKEDKNGHLHLSRKMARLARSWQQIVDYYKTGEIVTGTITSKTKGGLIVDVNGLETFLPGSQIDVKPVTDYDQYVGKTMDFKVVKINEAIRNAVVSHKALIESDIEQQRSVIIGQLEKGQVLEGTVKNVTDFGAFIDLGGVDGLLYITDISWGRVTHPTEVLHNGEKLNVVVLDFDDEKKRISLGLKQLTPHPWDNLPEEIQEGSTVKGKVVNIEDYGAFLEVLPGVEGLVHVSEISWSSQPVNAKEFFRMNEEHEARVVTLDKQERKMSLSIKQLSADPWATIEDRYPIDSRHKGVVKNITPYGVFVELETGIGGMIHISDLSWIKRYNHPGEFTKPGESIDVVILSIDKDNRKLSLGHKQLEEDPWTTFETVFPIGSVHDGSVTRRDEKGASIQLEYGLEAYAPARHLRKENGNLVEAEEVAPFMIIEFDRNEKRIMVSHTKVWEQAKNEEREAQKKEAAAESEKNRKAVKNIQAKVEKPTLGNLGALAELKQKMKQAEAEEGRNVDNEG
jgi:small subunit ribosomal protein S1